MGRSKDRPRREGCTGLLVPVLVLVLLPLVLLPLPLPHHLVQQSEVEEQRIACTRGDN